mmetsp:Transcript_7024/g.19066  ORF Transcript_7024/g.19066 Transcript_7024/m.19066 type:complete len:142 (+) Transcript_7024:414-839(+)
MQPSPTTASVCVFGAMRIWLLTQSRCSRGGEMYHIRWQLPCIHPVHPIRFDPTIDLILPLSVFASPYMNQPLHQSITTPCNTLLFTSWIALSTSLIALSAHLWTATEKEARARAPKLAKEKAGRAPARKLRQSQRPRLSLM